MITINVSSSEYGNNRQYIAHIIGRASKFIFLREFVGRKSGKRNEHTEYSTDEVGLYEDCDISRKGEKEIGYWLVASAPDGELVKMRSNLEEAMKIAKRLDEGEAIQAMIIVTAKTDHVGWTYQLRTKSEAKAATAGQTVDSAIEGCWALMQALPEREAKKVLAALKLRVSPPKPQAPAAEESPAESPVEPAPTE